MNSNAIELISVISWTTINAALCVVAAGLASGFVALGVVQTCARERIQKRVLDRFFSLSERLQVESGNEGSFLAASVLRMPRRVLCRLYYRQVAGQFLAALNAERAGETKRGGPVHMLLREVAAARVRGRKRLHEADDAVREIDVLQADLGDAVLRAVTRGMILGWWLIYAVLGGLASREGVREFTQQSGITSESGSVAAAVIGLAFALSASVVLALASAAAGVVAFSWLDRVTAAK